MNINESLYIPEIYDIFIASFNVQDMLLKKYCEEDSIDPEMKQQVLIVNRHLPREIVSGISGIFVIDQNMGRRNTRS